MGQEIKLVSQAMYISDYVAEYVFYLDRLYCYYFNQADIYLIDNFNFSLLSFCNYIESSYTDFCNYYNSFAVIKLMKAVENYLNYGCYHDFDIMSIKDSNLYILGRDVFIIAMHLLALIFFIFFIFKLLTVDMFCNTYFLFFRFSNETENNMSNFVDLKKMSFSFVFLISFFFSVFSYYRYSFTVTLFSFFMFFLNVMTVVSYMYFYNVNVYVYIKGLVSKTKLLLNFVLDNITLSIFVSRLVLQFIRLLICSSIFFIWHEMSMSFFHMFSELHYTLSMKQSNQYVVKSLKFIVEYLDMVVNFSSQYSIYIVSVMWLIPFLFTFVKEINKVGKK